jgi:hypothetical protein
MSMKRSGIKLAQKVNSIESGIDTITYWNINQPVFTSEGDSGFTTKFGQRI